MNIESKIGTLEFRAYEMRKLVRFLGNKVRSQKFTNQFIAYNADMSENEMLECMKLKPIKHEVYVKFFNSIVSIIANHREMNKENLECELIEKMKRDPLVEPNRISQIVEWNNYTKSQKSTVTVPKRVTAVKDKKTKEQVLDEITNNMLELVGLANPSYDKILAVKNVMCRVIKNIKDPVISYYKCTSIKDIICDLGAKNLHVTFGSYLDELQQKFEENVRYYFYPLSIPRLIIDKKYLTIIIDTYTEFMKKNYNMNKDESLKLLADKENSNKEIYQKRVVSKFLNKLTSGRQKRYMSFANMTEKRNMFDIDSIKPIRKDEFVKELLKIIGPYHKRKDNFKLNLDGSILNINAWTVGAAINNIYKELGIDNKRAFGLSNQNWERDLDEVAVKNIRRGLNGSSDNTISACVEKVCLRISELLQINNVDLCRGVVVNEIKKEVALLNEDLDNRLNSDQLKDFKNVINYLFSLEHVNKSRKNSRHPVILSAILKSFLPLVYSITPLRLAEVDANSKYVSDIGGVKFNPIVSLNTYNPITFKRYSYSIFEGLAQQLNNVLDGRNVDYKVIADELRAFVVYQVINHYDYYGIKPMDSDDKNDIAKSADMEVPNFNTVEEAEDYVESLFDSNKAEEIVEINEEDNNATIEEEENDENMRNRTLDLFEDDERIDDVVYRRGVGRRGDDVRIGEVYDALRTIEKYFNSRRVIKEDREDIIRIVKSFAIDRER